MLVRFCRFRFARLKHVKKDKEKWGAIDEWKNEKKIGLYDPEINPPTTLDSYLTADKIRHIVKFQENIYNSNRISTPILEEDKKRIAEFKMHFQYHQVKMTSTRNLEK